MPSDGVVLCRHPSGKSVIRRLSGPVTCECGKVLVNRYAMAPHKRGCRTREESIALFWSQVDKNGPIPVVRPELGPCWLWLGPGWGPGYGGFWLEHVKWLVHRLAYELTTGPIPDGLTLDHLCRVRRCVNPGHVEPVTSVENVMRGESLPAQHARRRAAMVA